MKRLFALLTCLVMVFALTGCGLFASGDSTQPAGPSKDVKITENYTHKDPAELNYAKCYAFYSPDLSALVEMFKAAYNATPVAEYVFIYADENDVALAEYTYYVMASEEDAKNFAAKTAEYGGSAEAVGNVTVQHSDKEAVANTIDSLIGMQALDSSSAESYAKSRKEMDKLIDYIPE